MFCIVIYGTIEDYKPVIPIHNKISVPSIIQYLCLFYLRSSASLIAYTPEIDCDQTAKGLPYVTSVEFLIAK
jgi:hypothetical protein